MIEALKSLIFLNKNTCYICRENRDDRREFFCSDCYESLDLKNERICQPVEYFDHIYYSALYNRFLREVIRDFKFHGKNYLSKPLGELMLDTIKKNEIDDIDLVLAVPMHGRKEAKRGYNQSELLARYIGKKLNIEVSRNNLIKTKNTRPQSSLDSLERRDNLKGVFTVKRKDFFLARKILLVDDIMTTGTTLAECGKVLYEAGVEKIVGLTLVSVK